ncbi:type II secretion system protein G [Roseimicrobium gellanilyticum]|uniref:Type II secretion system protein G n=1 Tax=Roseimicrobium gellanilyticum TaxID=748857 RepID=A0A366HWS2_9BACT|nr:type II secretion system protein GspG [Roseimicrobium gellanilyticum]RBP48139.1 type II secretion system protein G [Roseimicrobium gellanilyticum]
MSHPVQPGAKKKRWPWWVRLLGWLSVPVLVMTAIAWVFMNRQAAQHTGGKESYQKDWQAKAQLEELKFSLWLARRSNGKYPSEKDGGLGSVVLRRHKDEDKEEIGEPEEVTEKLKDPWGRRFRYRFPGVHKKDSYDLYSLGADGIEDTEDDIKNW